MSVITEHAASVVTVARDSVHETVMFWSCYLFYFFFPTTDFSTSLGRF